ncbi:hypothetical protein CVT24_007094 [Panaeolus cyanescens]|uniref:Galactose oxidase-like Early set domain-containing protein n=1 Tax=Panaeolus cyanescens TaxID=181874 RepID=A0A409YP11_9AGAR|nr:hypothetical protein CVT24_007094 [Panaeolus cyanescens]
MPASRIILGTFLLLVLIYTAIAVTPNGFEDGGHTKVSALMMFLGNEHSVYILDKAEGNAAQVAGHVAWASVWDIELREAKTQDVRSNVFCASGMHLPNGSFAAFGGNDAVGPGGKVGNQKNPGSNTGQWDGTYQNHDGRKAIRIVSPLNCRITDQLDRMPCKWYDEDDLIMKRHRWYSAAEATGTGEVVIIGGFVTGGYINRWWPNTDPLYSGGGAEPTYEFYPSRPEEPRIMKFMETTSGLNAYAHTYLMPSGKMFVQANLSTILWDYDNNIETPLPPMPKGVVRVYPASGATAMLPLTPKNNYTPTMIFCGGSDMADEMWGSYASPAYNTWTYPASKDCQRITPEPIDKSRPVVYEQDDDMPVGRSMSQFIALPNGKYLLVNGAEFGTAGYTTSGTPDTPFDQMPFGQSLAGQPVLKPAIYDPEAPRGKRWSQEGLFESRIPRMYHSTAVLLPDASVLLAGSNPNADVVLDAAFPTEYRADIFYPSYFEAEIRPSPKNVPTKLSYGGDFFDITIPASSYKGSANEAAESAKVVLIRTGFSTHAMQMGQRFLQLDNTFTVEKGGSIILHVSQLPPNPNLFQPGPAFLYVNIHGVPSNGTYVIAGSGNIERQPIGDISNLPSSVRLDNVQGGDDGPSSSNSPTKDQKNNKNGEKSNNMVLIISAAGGAAALVVLVIVAIVIMKRRRAERMRRVAEASRALPVPHSRPWDHHENSSQTAFVAYSKDDGAHDWNASSPALPGGQYQDDTYSTYSSQYEQPYDPYTSANRYPPGPQPSPGYASPQSSHLYPYSESPLYPPPQHRYNNR